MFISSQRQADEKHLAKISSSTGRKKASEKVPAIIFVPKNKKIEASMNPLYTEDA